MIIETEFMAATLSIKCRFIKEICQSAIHKKKNNIDYSIFYNKNRFKLFN